MPRATSVELLERVLSNDAISPADLDKLAAHKVSEDQFLEFKSGKWIDDKATAGDDEADLTPAQKIRKYVSGFANAEGGLLIVGIDDATRSVSGCVADKGGKPLGVWAADSIDQLKSRLHPLPRYQTVAHPNGNVFLAGVARSSMLVSCLESGVETYYYRNHDKTVRLAPALVGDLLLGRRQQPRLELSVSSVDVERDRLEGQEGKFKLLLRFNCEVVNVGPQWVDGIRLVLATWSTDQSRTSPELLNQVDAGDDAPMKGMRVVFRNSSSSSSNDTALEPFASRPIRSLGPFALPDLEWMTIRCAIGVLPRGGTPVWFEVTYPYTRDHLRNPAARKATTTMVFDRPNIAWKVDEALQ